MCIVFLRKNADHDILDYSDKISMKEKWSLSSDRECVWGFSARSVSRVSVLGNFIFELCNGKCNVCTVFGLINVGFFEPIW